MVDHHVVVLLLAGLHLQYVDDAFHHEADLLVLLLLVVTVILVEVVEKVEQGEDGAQEEGALHQETERVRQEAAPW